MRTAAHDWTVASRAVIRNCELNGSRGFPASVYQPKAQTLPNPSQRGSPLEPETSSEEHTRPNSSQQLQPVMNCSLRRMQLTINTDLSIKTILNDIRFLSFTVATYIGSGIVYAEQTQGHQPLLCLPWSISGRILLFFIMCFPASSASSVP